MGGDRRLPASAYLTAGFLAWLGMVALWYALGPALGIRLGGIAGFTGSLLTGRPGLASEWVGRAVLLAVALGWGLLYRPVRELLVGPEWTRGMVYGLAIWLVTGLVLLPLLDAVHPLRGAPGVGTAGAFGLGFAGLPGAMVSLLGHGLFGLTLGLYVGSRARAGEPAAAPVDPNDPRRPDQDS